MRRRLLTFALLVLLVVAGVMVALASGYLRVPGSVRDDVIRLVLPPPSGEVGLPEIRGPLDPGRPLIVIDAGHGGFDPGAGTGRLHEKDITLALARAVRDELLRAGGVRVALTRDSDRYLMLQERAGMARRLGADLFLSIHADSAADPEAKGASIYTLSERGSSEIASQLARDENRADTVNGVALAGNGNAVNAILVDLSQRESAAQSVDLARLILREGQGVVDFKDRSIQSAAFIVLKSADLPSALYEAGYISNASDAERLSSKPGQKAFAEATARAIRAYFARHQAQ